MADQRDGISYCDKTWNVCTGCTQVSPGCQSCWAKGMVRRIEAAGHGGDNPTVTCTGAWNGGVQLMPQWLSKPLHWRKPRVILVQTLGDLFHDGVPFSYIAAVYGVMAACQQHTFLVLTKRPERMLEFHRWLDNEARDDSGDISFKHALAHAWRETLLEDGDSSVSDKLFWEMRDLLQDTITDGSDEIHWPPRNIMLGISAENQAELNERWKVLRQVQAARYWLSLEPLLGPLDFSGDVGAGVAPSFVAVGPETGTRARPCEVERIRSVVRQCRDAGVPVHVKAVPVNGKPSKKPEEWPEDLRIREEVPR